MAAASGTTSKENQPITLEQAMLLEVDQLIAEIARLENSIAHLQRTQDELLSFLQESPEEDEDGELKKAVEENEGSISGQDVRITLIKTALANKVGVEAARHYGLDPTTGNGIRRGGRQQSPPDVPPAALPSDETRPDGDGLHL